jgi:F-type H+-transporting ATPase subunit b
MPQLDPTWFVSQLFWLAITFSVLYFVLARLILPPLQEVMARRAHTVEGDVAQAQDYKSQAEQAKNDYERALAESRGKAVQLMSDAMAEHKEVSDRQTKDMDKKIEERLHVAMQSITAKKTEMITVLTPTAAELTTMIVEKLTNVAPAGDKVGRMLDEIAKGRR